MILLNPEGAREEAIYVRADERTGSAINGETNNNSNVEILSAPLEPCLVIRGRQLSARDARSYRIVSVTNRGWVHLQQDGFTFLNATPDFLT
ncbi:MAG: hypothetical protein HUU41_19865 [Bryobacteraceae bacterium]|nr:hypothetical protein [Bryobacteraceae bacterium]